MYFNKFFVKLGIKNVVFPFIVLGYLFYVFLFRNETAFGLEKLIIYYTYPMILGAIGLGVLSTYYVGKSNEVVDYIYENKFKKFMIVTVSITSLSLIVFLIPLSFMLSASFMKLNLDFYLLRVILSFFTIYFVFNLFFIVIGGFIGTVFKGYKKYILFSIISALLTINAVASSDFSNGKAAFSDLISIGYDSASTMVNYQSAVIFNKAFWLDKLFPLFIIASIISFLYFLYHKKNKKISLIILSSIIPLSVVFTVSYSGSYTHSSENEVNAQSNRIQEYFVDGYEMEIDLIENLNSSAVLRIYCKENLYEDLKLELDESYEVQNIYINDKEVSHSRNNEFITINKSDIEDNLTKDTRNILLRVNYSGEKERIIALNEKEKIWYPRVEEFEKNFQITSKSTEPVKSNLNKLSENYENEIYTTIFNSFDSEVFLLHEEINTLNLPYETYSYDMNLDLANRLESTVKTKVKNNSKGKEDMLFSLYSELIIESLEINGKEVDYDREKNIVSIDKSNLPKEDFVLEITYKGEINLKNNLDMRTAYVYKRDISLVDEIIAWYPMFDDLEKDFNISAKSKVEIFSNLDSEKIDKNNYVFSGRDTGITLVGGNMTQLESSGYDFILPKSFLYLDKNNQDDLLKNVLEMNSINQNKVILTSAYGENYRYKNSAVLDFYLIGN